MTVYADVLIVVNTFVNFFVLLFCAWINKIKYKTFRLISGALLGGISALSIFLTIDSVVFELLIKGLTASIMVVTAFGFVKIKVFLRNVAVLFLTTYLFAGIMFAVWFFLKPSKILINNSVVYFDVSVTFLIIVTTLIYFVITFVSSLLKKEALTAEKCKVTLYLHNKDITFDAIFDTGNSLKDPFGSSEIVTVGQNKIYKLCGNNPNSNHLSDRYRILPCRTVSGNTLLEGVRCDKMKLEFKGSTYDFESPIAVISKTEFSDEFDAVLNSEILEKMR